MHYRNDSKGHPPIAASGAAPRPEGASVVRAPEGVLLLLEARPSAKHAMRAVTVNPGDDDDDDEDEDDDGKSGGNIDPDDDEGVDDDDNDEDDDEDPLWASASRPSRNGRGPMRSILRSGRLLRCTKPAFLRCRAANLRQCVTGR